jgi:hypothetical protein
MADQRFKELNEDRKAMTHVLIEHGLLMGKIW